MDAVSLRARILLRIVGEVEALSGPPTVSELIDESNLGTPPTIFKAIAELVSGGWVTRHADKRDGRSTRLRLSPSSRRAFARMSREIERLAG